MPASRTRTIPWARIERTARERFGVRAFRAGQREILEAVLAGRDVLGILPTGGGKSLCYQLPALFSRQPTVVVSPLIALMQDQQEKLQARDIPAAKLDSTLTTTEEREAIDDVVNGDAELVYVTPERLENAEYLDLLKRAGVAALVVDEAHCVSQWGHDFRPAYLGIRDAVRALGRPPVLALTATATPAVLEDVKRQLAIEDALVVNAGIDRPNLQFEVHRAVNDDVKRERLLEILSAERGTGIVYVATTKTADELQRWLLGQGVDAGRYHAKMRTSDRVATQDRFMGDGYRVIVATKAFGLGIDKPNIRFVVHWQFPDSLESYTQEAGRAGRDGEPARATLLYRLEDRRIQTYFLGGKYPRRDESERIWRVIRTLAAESPRGVTLRDVMGRAELSERRTKVVVAQLAGAGVVDRGRRLRLVRDFATPEELEEFLTAYERRHAGDRDRLDAMMHYAESTACRVKMLRAYFGEPDPRDCGRCDNCRSPLRGVAAATSPAA